MEKTEASGRLLGAARALMARGQGDFTIAAVCAEAGLERKAFRAHFTGKAALLAALAEARPEPAQPAVPATDAWLERRLRVFERALNALENQAETRARQQDQAIARLEERLFALGQGTMPPAPAIAAEEKPVAEEPETVAAPVETPIAQDDAPLPESLPPAPQPLVTVSREEMAGMVQAARGKAVPVPEEKAPRDGQRLRWLAIGMLSLVALFLCVGLTLGTPASAAREHADGIAYRRAPQGETGRMVALADAGDAAAQAQLALAYLRGAGVTRDASAAARWSQSAARQGQPVAQYVLGTLYHQGDGVPSDPARAFALFAAAAARGNLKAMHNLAIAYAEGLGTAKDEAQAAQWFERAARRGYVDSAFDLGVLHERGLGVAQDPVQALAWYVIAARAGDGPSAARAVTLRGQLSAEQAQAADQAALAFAPLAAPLSANRL